MLKTRYSGTRPRREPAWTTVIHLHSIYILTELIMLVKGVSGGSRTPKIIVKFPDGTKLCSKHDIPVPGPGENPRGLP